MATPRRDVTPLIIGAFLVGATWFVTWAYYRQIPPPPSYWTEAMQHELAAYQTKYGPHQYSINAEEWLTRDFFQDERDGVFLDVGAAHHQFFSNTYYLETQLGWSGVAIDALTEFAEGYKRHRPRTTYLAMFASDVPNQSVRFFVPDKISMSLMASSDEHFSTSVGGPVQPRNVPTTTLNIALEQAGVSRLDFLSMDIELSEPAALRGF